MTLPYDPASRRGRAGRAASVCTGVAAVLALATAAHASATRPVAGALTPERLKLPSGPSSVRGLAGEPTVDPFRAEVGYRVPIELPGGYGGLAPGLALTYSGALGNGPIGIGWTLELPRIQRSTRLGVPKYDQGDELELIGIAGGRLVPTGTGEYRVEGMGQTVRIRPVDGGFVVDNGSGTTYRLGTSAATRQGRDASSTFAWLVETQTNTQGEQIAYQYLIDQGQVYPSLISWGPGGVFSAGFAYQTRGDATRSFREGFSVITARRLQTVTVTAFGTVRRTYQLDYDETLAVARLAHVNSAGIGGPAAGAWPALAFHYFQPAAPQVTPITGIDAWRLNQNGTVLADLDGDGAADLLQIASGGHSYRPNRDGGFQPPIALPGAGQAITNLQLQDIDGDARPELVQSTSDGWLVWKFQAPTAGAGPRWVLQPGNWPGTVGLALKSETTTRFADLDGDGLVDGIKWNSDGLLVARATRTGLGPLVQRPKIGGSVLPTASGRFIDVNGDGLDDYVLIALDHLEIYLGHGDGSFEPVHSVAYPFTGNLGSTADIELADLDRDGLLDLIKIDAGNVRWFRGLPGGTFSTQVNLVANPEPLSATVVVTVADTNGNGSHDLVWSSTSGMWRMDLAGITTAGMLREIENGLGLDVTLTYQSSHSLSAAARAANNPWTSEVPIAMPVPTHKTTALGLGETPREVSYSVRDGFWDAVEQRFGGFLTTIVTTAGATPAQTAVVTTNYLAGLGADRELRGKASKSQVADGTGAVIATTTNAWQTMAIAGLPDTPLLRRAILTRTGVEYPDFSPSRTTEVLYSYDPLGRASHVVDNGRADLPGDESITDTSYADDDTTWVRDQVCEIKISGTDGTLVRDVQHQFGDDHTVAALGTAGKGWPRLTQFRLASEARWVTQLETRYDAHGNPTTIIDHGVERRLDYDDIDLFPLHERVTAPSGELVWTASWDRVLGQITDVTDPSGHTTHSEYDSLGRFSRSRVDDHVAHQEIVYDWTLPVPKTTTWRFDGALADVTPRPADWSANSHWRQSVDVSDGLGDVHYRAVRLATAQWIVTDYRERDASGRTVFAGRPVLAGQLEITGRPAGITGDIATYDAIGRVLTQTLPTGGTRSFAYQSFERTTQEGTLAPVHSVLDGKGRAVLTERSLDDGTHEIVQATYDPAGRLTRMTLDGVVTRSFDYDTLGRIQRASDPDLGLRTLTWDDGDRLRTETNAAGQTVAYSYDALGRLATRDDGSLYTYHYDAARPGAAGPLANLGGRLAYVDEPTGGLDLGYDEAGRTAFTRRRIDDRTSEATTGYAASGLVLARSYDDGFSFAYHYDPAGRATAAGDLWTVIEQDAAGMPRHERTAGGADTMFDRNAAELPTHVTVRDAGGTAIYEAQATRDPLGLIHAIADLDGTGLDHSATFDYDGFARLASATAGTGDAAIGFTYHYDVLHNMTARTATRPTPGVFAGTYRYAEDQHAPRQLTSITDDAGQVLHSFDYDAAGREIRQDGRTMTFNASDRLLQVTGVAGGTVAHAYGHDGQRIRTIDPSGTVTYLFGDGTQERAGSREHDVTVGSRVVARVAIPSAGAASHVGAAVGRIARIAAVALGGLALAALAGAGLAASSRRLRQRARAIALLALLGSTSCTPSLATRTAASTVPTTTFLHAGFAAGPVVFTDATGHLVEERRFEPFGASIDARFHGTAGDTIGLPDFVARDLNVLGERTEPATAWSDHGARWMTPETARWLTPDPPVVAPDPKFMFEPWALHPYQYVQQNPISFWDPDGRDPDPTLASSLGVDEDLLAGPSLPQSDAEPEPLAPSASTPDTAEPLLPAASTLETALPTTDPPVAAAPRTTDSPPQRSGREIRAEIYRSINQAKPEPGPGPGLHYQPGALVVTETTALVLVTSVIHDPTTGKDYTSYGFTLVPGLGVNVQRVLVSPDGNHTREDVITGWAFNGSLSTPGLTAGGVVSVNSSGVMYGTSGGAGTGGIGVGGSWTIEGGPLYMTPDGGNWYPE